MIFKRRIIAWRSQKRGKNNEVVEDGWVWWLQRGSESTNLIRGYMACEELGKST